MHLFAQKDSMKNRIETIIESASESRSFDLDFG